MRASAWRLISVGFLLFACGENRPPAVTCKADETACGSGCANLKLDDLHCGSCDKACGADSGCASGACFPRACGSKSCNPASVCYDSACVEKSCVGIACPAGRICAQGACVCG